tara:strand:- start:12121 stop:12858 length:738 start_codon:yes stop_codon:yes gene_type:complete
MEVQNELEDIIKDQLQHNGGISLLTLKDINQNFLVETIALINTEFNSGQGTNLGYKLSDANLDELWDKLKTKKQVLDSVSNKRPNLLDNNNSPDAKKSKIFNNNNKGNNNKFSTPISESQKFSEQNRKNIIYIMNKTNNYWSNNRKYVNRVLKTNNNNVNETIVELDIKKIMDLTGMNYNEAKQMYFDSDYNSYTAIENYKEIKRLQEENTNNNNNNDNNNNNNNNNNNDNNDNNNDDWLDRLGL